jgi:AmmeMemoRadiSam system protein A
MPSAEPNPEERTYLLALARETIAAELDGRSARAIAPPAVASGALAAGGGAFVTLHARGRLRGCIGRMSGPPPLAATVRAMARAAAFEDPRFPPLGRGELAACSLEISVLSPMVPCPDPDQVEPGAHGVYLAWRGRSGVFLPQVATEQGWDRAALLQQLGLKAGLDADAYLRPDAQLYTFTACVFGEAESAPAGKAGSGD